MSCDRFQKMLDDYVDGALDSDATRATEAHLDRCPRCRGIEQELRSLLEAAEDLPRGIAPERDLLPGIREAVGMTKQTMPSALPSKAAPSWSRWVGLAASLFLLSAAVITFLRLGGPAEPIPVAATSGGVVAANFESADPYRAAEDDYIEATRQLLAVIEERRDHLSPETLAVLEKNLAIIDRAIAEVHAALEAEPGDTGSELVLTGMYQQKIELLRRVSRLSS